MAAVGHVRLPLGRRSNSEFRKGQNMGAALTLGRRWKKALVTARLDYAKQQIPRDAALVQRYEGELRTLDVENRASYDLVKRNLEARIRAQREDLAAYEGYLGHKTALSRDDSNNLAVLRSVIADLEKMLRDLEAEGRPPP